MRYQQCHHRQRVSFFWKEHRLCYVGAEGIDRPHSTPPDIVSWWKDLLRDGARALGEFTKNWIGWPVKETAFGIIKGLWEAYGPYPTREQKQEIFQRLNFYDAAPAALQQRLEQEFEHRGLTAEMIRDICDIGKWTAALQKRDFFDSNNNPDPIPLASKYDPENFLLSLRLEDRHQILIGFLDNYITNNTKKDTRWQALLHANDAKDTTARVNGMLGDAGFETATSALAGMFGTADLPPGDAQKMAKDALTEHYSTNKAAFEYNRNIRGDYEQAVRYQHFLHGSPPSNAADLMRDLNLPRNKLATPLLGALKLGVMNDATLGALRDMTDKTDQELLQVKLKVLQDKSRLRGDVTERIRDESFELKNIWNRASGIEKLVAIVAIGYALYRKPSLAAWAAGAYWSWKVLARDEHPLQTWADAANRQFDKVRQTNDNFWHGLGKDVPFTGPKFLRLQADIIANFLHGQYDADDLETETKAFMLLGGQKPEGGKEPITLARLAKAYETNGSDVGGWRLDVGRRGMLDEAMQDLYPDGYTEVRAFFDNPDNVEQTSEAFSFTLYLAAVKDQSIRNDPKVREDMETVRVALGKLQNRMAITKLQGPARAAYNRLVLKGKYLCLDKEHMTLIDFMRSIVGVPDMSAGTDIPDAERKKKKYTTDARDVAPKSDADVKAARTDAVTMAATSDARDRAGRTDAADKASTTDAHDRAASADADTSAERADARDRSAVTDSEDEAGETDAEDMASSTDAEDSAAKSDAKDVSR